MQVYKYEILDGLSAQVQTQASIAYCSPVILSSNDNCKLSDSFVNKI